METEIKTETEPKIETKSNKKDFNAFMIPGSIVIAGVIIAGAIVWTNLSPTNGGPTLVNKDGEFGNNLSESAKNVHPIDASDHVRGNIGAPVAIIEFSDFECPFCARFHPTVKQILDEYPEDVKWVYRHFPLTTIHNQALSAALASECVSEIGGNDAFWTFADTLFTNQSSLGKDFYIETVRGMGLSVSEFESCFDSEKYLEKVQRDAQNAIDSGGGGTPFNVVINAKGELFPFSGALPYEQVRLIIEAAIES